MKEIWKDIPEYEGLYQVSNLGNVRSLNYNRTGEIKLLKQGNVNGYKVVILYKDGKKKNYLVHRLVAIAFLPNPNNLPIINHKDENPSNNNVNNLEWCTQAYNTNYGEGIKRRVQSRLLSGEGRHPIIVLDELSGIETTYPTIRNCIKSLHITARTIYKYIGTGISYKNKKFNYYE